MDKQRFQSLETALNTFIGAMNERQIKAKGGLINAIPSIPIFEGTSFGRSEMRELSTSVPISDSLARETDIWGMKATLKQLSGQIFESLERGLFASLDEQISPKMRIDAGHQPFSWELYIHMLEKMDWDFDPAGSWIKPEWGNITPEAIAAIEQVLQNAATDPAKVRQFMELYNRKRAEFNDREATRKLVK